MRFCRVKTSSSNLAYLTKKGRELIATTTTPTAEETCINLKICISYKAQEDHKILVIKYQNPSFLIFLHHAFHMSMVQPSIYINGGIYYITNAEYQVTLLLSAFLIYHYLELSQHIWGTFINAQHLIVSQTFPYPNSFKIIRTFLKIITVPIITWLLPSLTWLQPKISSQFRVTDLMVKVTS